MGGKGFGEYYFVRCESSVISIIAKVNKAETIKSPTGTRPSFARNVNTKASQEGVKNILAFKEKS